VVAIARGVAVVTQIADNKVTAGEATLELDLEGWVAQEAFTLAATEEDNRSTLRRIDEVGGDQGNALNRKERGNQQGTETEHSGAILKHYHCSCRAYQHPSAKPRETSLSLN
jgi:hypothetical protein